MTTSHTEASLADAFAHHLRDRSSTAAVRLAQNLAETGNDLRAGLLRSFAERGPHTVPATWWSETATCHLGLDLPVDPSPGDLWFDPLEVTCHLAQTYPHDRDRPDTGPRRETEFRTWFAVEPVADWQAWGAQVITRETAGRIADFTANMASHYSRLFNKALAGRVDWSLLVEEHGMAVALRVWGTAPRQLGTFTSESSVCDVLTVADLERYAADPYAAENSVDEEVTGDYVAGLPFRTTAVVPYGVGPGPGELQRTWSR
ncbi:MAG: hypothetical protein ACK5MT_02310 [Actinomycetales bacterium]